jgi:glucose uptake protein GlcU
MTWEHAVVLILAIIALAIGVYGIRMERRDARRAAMQRHPSNYDDMARVLERDREFTRIRREHLDGIRAAEVHE